MLRAGVASWLQINDKDPVKSTSNNFFNVTSNGTSTTNSVYQPQPLILKSESSEADASQINIIVTCSLLCVVLLHGIFSQSRKAGVSGLFTLACLTMTAVLAPVVGSILLLLACYRQCVFTVLKATCKRGAFAGLLKGNDAFWALEDDTSKSVINILALADFSFIVEASNKGIEPLRTIQELIEDRLLSHPAPFPKLLCYRRKSLGYFYWERQPYINVNDHVRWMELNEHSDNCGFISETVLKNYVSVLSNAPLPADHLSGWEILIGRYPISMDCSVVDPLDVMENGGNLNTTPKYPVLFRVHHTLGDGVALVRLLLDALADPCTRTPSRTPTPSYETNIPPILINNKEIHENEKYFKSAYLNIPSGVVTNDSKVDNFHNDISKMKKSASYNFEDWNSHEVQQYSKPIGISTSLGDCVRVACRKFINLIEETNRLNHLQYQTQSLQNINILINDHPSSGSDILNIINSSETNITVTTDNLNYQKNGNCVTRENRKKFKELFTDEIIENNNYDNKYNYFYKFVKEKIKLVKNIVYHLAILTMLPATVMNQVITRTYDENALHGPKLSGYKVVGWYLENEEEENLLLMTMIKRIRLRTGAHFSDVVLTALSNSFEIFFRRFNEVPNEITAVIPARIGRPDRDEDYNAKISTATIKSKELNAKITKLYLDRNAKRNHSVLYESSQNNLDNKFSVALLTLPIASKSNNVEGLFTKLKRVQKYTDVLRKSADYLVNYWILNVIATFFPIPCLRQMVKSTQSSIVVSNMPGPQKLAKLAGHLLHNIVFWVPNKETTGIGITILSYGGRLQLGIIADRALIPCSEDAQLIVNGVVDAIKKMDEMSTAAA